MRKRYFYTLTFLVFLVSCEKEEDLLSGKFITDQVGQADMISQGNKDYQMQLYFDLSSGELKAQNRRDAWDLAFSCNSSNLNIFANPGMLLAIAATGDTTFNRTYDPSNFSFQYERSGNFYTRGWITRDFEGGEAQGQVYIIDLARDWNNQRRGYKLIKVLRANAEGYSLKISNLDQSNLKVIQIPMDSRFNNVFISLSNPEQVLQLEPLKDEWDLFFSRYMERLYDGSDTLDYSVTGCLINPFETLAYLDLESSQDSTKSYASLSIEDVDISLLTNRQDAVGHDWKYFDLDAEAFVVRPRNNFFMKDNEDVTYRFRFTGFYSSEGEKGAVTFEYLPL